MHSPKILISSSEIADLAGVDISTVSNWRRRFDGSFPPPAVSDDAGKRPKFDRALVVEWLRQNPALGNRASDAGNNILQAMELLRSHIGVNQLTEVVGRLLVLIAQRRRDGFGDESQTASEIREEIGLVGSDRRDTSGEIDVLQAVPAPRLEAVYRALLLEKDPLAVYDELISRQLTRFDQSAEQTTPDTLKAFLLDLAEPGTGVAYDPAAGLGGLLLDAIRTGRASRGMGVEINESAAETAKRRIFLSEENEISIVTGNSLLDDPAANVKADLVITDPPLGLALARPKDVAPQQWEFGTPPSSNADTAFLQHAIAHLLPHGRAIVVTTLGVLAANDKATVHIRGELVRRGSVEAIFILPSRLRVNTSIRVAVWVLRTPDQPNRRSEVLLVDAGTDDPSTIRPGGTVLDSFHRWSNDPGAELDPTIAVAIPVTELLAPDANLVPSRWMTSTAETLTPLELKEEASDSYESAQNSVRTIRDLPDINLAPSGSDSQRKTIEQLRKDGQLSLVKGRHADRADNSEATYPVLTVNHVRPGANLNEVPADRVAQSPSTAVQLVQPGDVLVYLDGQTVAATVWTHTGWVLGRFMQIVRVDAAHWDAQYVAAAISNPINGKYVVGGAMRTHFDLALFELVEQPLIVQREIASLVEELDSTLASARNAQAQLQVARTDVLNALTSGLVTLDHE